MLIGYLNYSGYERLRSWRQSYALLLLGTFAVVWAADFFLYGHRVGWTAAVVAAAMLGVLAIRDTRFLDIFGGRVAWIATLGLLLALIEQPTSLNVLYVLVCLGVLAFVNTQGWDNDFLRWLGRFGRWITVGWTRLFRDNGLAMRWLIRRGLSPTLARGIAAWVIPFLLASVFIAIFAWANPIISGWFDQLGALLVRWIEQLPDLLNPLRIFFWIAFAIFAWSLMRSRTWRVRKRHNPPPLTAQYDARLMGQDANPSATAGIPASMVIRCLVLFNLVFAVELALDLFVMLSLKFGDNGTAFKTYVRRGAYPLVAAALLAGAFVLLTFRPKSQTEQSPWARKLVYFWIGQTILLTLSAVWRLVRYIDLTELTRLRVASTVWFILVGCGLFYIVWRIVRGRSNAWLININAITALVLLYPCCFINFDGMIASFNARHCEEVGGGGSPLDIAYFQDLGAPALPALDGVRDHLVGDARQQWAKAVSVGLHAQLDADLNDWHAWTWRRARSARAADEINVQLAKARAAASEQLAQVPSLKGAGASASASASAASAAAAAIVATPETIETSH